MSDIKKTALLEKNRDENTNVRLMRDGRLMIDYCCRGTRSGHWIPLCTELSKGAVKNLRKFLK